MDLVLWRHAEAQEWTPGCDDMARSLTSRGEKQATRMAHWLDRQLPGSAKIFVSPALRADQTASALGCKFKISNEIAPQGSAAQLLELVQWPHAKGVVVVVGHQPMLGQVIAQLIGLSAQECPVKKGAIWWLRSRARNAQSETVLVTVQSPDML